RIGASNINMLLLLCSWVLLVIFILGRWAAKLGGIAVDKRRNGSRCHNLLGDRELVWHVSISSLRICITSEEVCRVGNKEASGRHDHCFSCELRSGSNVCG